MGESLPTQVLNVPFVGKPNSLCTETYILIGPYSTETECENVCSYIKTRFFRFMVAYKKNTQHATKGVYQFVPMQDFSKPWTDEELYMKYNLTKDEIAFIESMIKPME
jgi:site-specific DNA-methyltransferase (adenine-specific)